MPRYLPFALLSLALGVPSLAADRYTQAAGSTLGFTFTQLGADASGSFGKFTTELRYDARDLGASSLVVTVQMSSLDTGDAERDEALAGEDLFDTRKFPTAKFVSTSLEHGAAGLVAVGKLTLRGVSRELRLPLDLAPTANGLTLSGQTVIRRLDFGVGQGEWQATDSVGDDVRVAYKVNLVRLK